MSKFSFSTKFNTMKMFQQIKFPILLALIIQISCGSENDIGSSYESTDIDFKLLIIGDWVGESVYTIHPETPKKREYSGKNMLDYRITSDSVKSFFYPFNLLKPTRYQFEGDSIRIDIEEKNKWGLQHVDIISDTLYLTLPVMNNGDIFIFTMIRSKFDSLLIANLALTGVNTNVLNTKWVYGEYNNYPWFDSIDFKPFKELIFSDDSVICDGIAFPIEIRNHKLSLNGVNYHIEVNGEEAIWLRLDDYQDKKWGFPYHPVLKHE